MQSEHDKFSRADLDSLDGTDSSNYHAAQARSIIEVELDDCRHIILEQQSALRAALDLVSRIADSERVGSNAPAEDGFSVDSSVGIPDAPPLELIFMLFPGYQWSDHISEESFERMAAEILEEHCKGQVFQQISVCVYVRAIFHFLYLARSTTSSTVRNRLFQTTSTYIAAAVQSIHKFDILAAPSLLSIQALLSINQCWILNSYAARQITALGHHKIQDTAPSTGVQRDVHNALLWCFFLDKTLSSLLGRPSSLPDLNVSSTDLIGIDSSLPYGSLFRICLEIAQIQDKLSNRRTMDTLDDLETRMRRLLPDLQGKRNATHRSMELDWISADFCFYAVMVEIHRTRLRCSFSPMIRRETLLCARRSVEAFQYLQQHPTELPGFNDPYPSFLTWSLLFYPLSPCFVLFCNIIGSLDRNDYDLMRNIIQALSQYKHDPHLQKLFDLLASLEKLCEPLFQADDDGYSHSHQEAASSLYPRVSLDPAAVHSLNEGTEAGHMSAPDGDLARAMEVASGIPTPVIGSSGDWLMWQLFNTQVPLGWMNPEFAGYGAL
ncbi:transcription factor domain-containing protein [Aspergillus saccharolyticus JOP 1030-1]|uniref:Xylanolytic transcriptional activator regulatory domain-containing protein n=1 Tax=Aspergillus saccharolyticus JOP 1030-1 TaxID=1450539 RepID=A0A318ZXG2_9EURO|nr:hypothetical protein BP01DRAFT_413372 [Aspergillus saccharolyticus JOP 1030-1]PYH49003.1 hypothetical protein BP01DRAFT_413372 [Aspergillus saccharolyticus JOP 1030-1]